MIKIACKIIAIIFILSHCMSLEAQYLIEGQIDSNYNGYTAYLCILDDWNDFQNIDSEMILKSVRIDNHGHFQFGGDELPMELGFYGF